MAATSILQEKSDTVPGFPRFNCLQPAIQSASLQRYWDPALERLLEIWRSQLTERGLFIVPIGHQVTSGLFHYRQNRLRQSVPHLLFRATLACGITLHVFRLTDESWPSTGGVLEPVPTFGLRQQMARI